MAGICAAAALSLRCAWLTLMHLPSSRAGLRSCACVSAAAGGRWGVARRGWAEGRLLRDEGRSALLKRATALSPPFARS